MRQNATKQLPAKLFFALMARTPDILRAGEKILAGLYGNLECEGELYAFDMTRYYESEFGTDLCKCMIAAEALIASERLAAIKRETNAIEVRLAQEAGSETRVLNIDPGILELSRVILATTKDHAHRIYMGDGIYEEITLLYRKDTKAFDRMPWTYADYRSPERIAYFGQLRERYYDQVKALL
jgi:hypothetical protein